MNKILLPIIFLCMSLMFLSSAATADAGMRFGSIVQQVDYSEPGADLEFVTLGMMIGYDLSNAFGVELRAGTSMKDDTIHGVSVKIDKYISALARLSAHGSTNITPSVYAGYTKGWLVAPGYGETSEAGLSYGVALDFNITREFTVGLEWMSLLDKDAVEADSFGIKMTIKI